MRKRLKMVNCQSAMKAEAFALDPQWLSFLFFGQW